MPLAGRTRETAPPCLPHRRRVLLGALLAGLVLPGAGIARAAAPTGPATLTVTMGPRQAPWKRVFNPFLQEAETRWPAAAGIYEPLVVYNRATATYVPVAGHGLPVEPRQHQAEVRRSSGRRLVRRHALHGQGRGLHLRPHAQVPGPRPRAGLAVPDRRDGPRRPHRRVHLQGDLHPGAHHHRQPGHRARAQVEGRGPARGLRRPEPGRHGALQRSGAVRADGVRAGPEPSLLAGRGSRRWACCGCPSSAATRRSCRRWPRASWTGPPSSCPTSRRAGWPKNPARHQYWYPDLGPTVLLYLNTRRKPFDDRERAQGDQHGPRPAPGHDARPSAATPRPADATGLAESQKKLEGRRPGRRRHLDEARPGAGQSAPGRRGPRPRRRRRSRVPGGERHALRPPRRPGVDATGWWRRASSARTSRRRASSYGQAPGLRRLGSTPSGTGRSTWGSGSAAGDRRPTSSTAARWTAPLVRPIGEEAEENFHRFASEEAGRLLRRFEATADVERAGGPRPRPPEAVRRAGPQPSPVREPPLGRLQHRALQRLPQPPEPVRERRPGRVRLVARPHPGGPAVGPAGDTPGSRPYRIAAPASSRPRPFSSSSRLKAGTSISTKAFAVANASPTFFSTRGRYCACCGVGAAVMAEKEK